MSGSHPGSLDSVRFPGGNFASGYHWEDGIGPLVDRPEKPNPAWPVWEPNHVGTDEWLTLCELVGAEPMICINAGNGAVEEAVNWVRYCNDPPHTEWGRRRAANGHPTPYNVRLWEVGNELWGTFQINWATSEDYGERFARFAEAMKAADPSIQLIAIGGDMPGALLQKAQGEAMPSLGAEYARHALAKAGDKAWAIAEHAVMGGVLRDASADEAYLSLVAHAHHVGMLLEENRRRLAELAPHVLVTQTEQMVAVGGPDRPSDSSLTAAVVWATFANWFLRSDGFVPLFTRSAMINHGDLLAKERGVVYPFPGYHGQAMYANQPGRTPVRVEMEGPVMRVPAGPFPAAELPCLDAVGLLSVDGEHLAVLLVNRHPEQRIETELEPAGFAPSDRAEVQVLGAARYSERNTWYAPDHVKPFVEHRPVREGRLRIAVPPHSVCVVVFKRASGALA